MMQLLHPASGCSWCRLNFFIRSLSSYQPSYNYGLSGKGKSRSNLPVSYIPKVQGEVLFGLHPTMLALKMKRRQSFHCAYVDKKFQDREKRTVLMEQIFELLSHDNIPVQLLARNVLDQLAGNRPHQGVCMDVSELQISQWSGQDSLASRTASLPLWLLLHNVQDPMNLGAILRSAHYLGVDQVVLPASDSCKLSPVVSKASAGALEIVNLMRLSPNTAEIEFCKWWQAQGGMVVGTGAAVDGQGHCVELEQFTLTSPTLIILGNEGSGLGKELEDICNKILTIPGHTPSYLADSVDSLNVSVAAGIMLHWMRTSLMNKR